MMHYESKWRELDFCIKDDDHFHTIFKLISHILLCMHLLVSAHAYCGLHATSGGENTGTRTTLALVPPILTS